MFIPSKSSLAVLVMINSKFFGNTYGNLTVLENFIGK